MLRTDAAILLPDIFLEKVDRPTMAHGVEARVPFLDGELSRYAMGLPARLKIKRLQKKWILRRSLRGIVPDDILDGKKTGFSVPYGYWLRKPLASFLRSTVLDGVSRPLFDRQQLVKCLDEHAAGRGRHGFLLHKLFNLALWHGQYVAGS